MKCPHCGYEHGWNGELQKDIEGLEGDFYQLPVDLQRREDWRSGRTTLYACPKCGVAFIEI